MSLQILLTSGINLCFCNFLACGGTFTSLNGSFASPGYPKWAYPNIQKCQYEIRVPTDRRIVLTIEAFDLEARYDFLWVKQVASGKIVDMALLTGTHIDGRRFTSVENVLILLFTSDGSGRDRGFAVSYHTIESGKLWRLNIVVIVIIHINLRCTAAGTWGQCLPLKKSGMILLSKRSIDLRSSNIDA